MMHGTMTNTASPICYLPFRGVLGGAVALCERLPSAPAVYAWLRTVSLAPHLSPNAFVDAVNGLIEAPAAPSWQARVGPLHGVTLESKTELSSGKKELLVELSANDEFRRHVGEVLSVAARLQAPLYVGKAANLQRRVLQHLDPMSELSVRLRDVGSVLDDCTLAYLTVESISVPQGADERQVLLLMEEIVTRVCRAGFVIRPG